jgi:hypothetical protein
VRLWAAFVRCKGLDGRTRVSLLTVHASNRHGALLAIREKLPENPALCDDDGHLLPYSVDGLRQCRESEVEGLMRSFLGLVDEGWEL